MSRYFERHLTNAVETALLDTPAVFIAGPRQAGKTTMCMRIAERRRARYESLDDPNTLAAALRDPAGFVGERAGTPRGGLIIIDEIQKAPALLPVIKHEVDRKRKPGRFLLTGSADILSLPEVAQALAGRIEILTMWPLSQGELAGRRERFVDTLLGDGALPSLEPGASRAHVIDLALRGGFPEPHARRDPDRRTAWFQSYATTLLIREVQDRAEIEGLTELPRLLKLLASRSAMLLNVSDLSRRTGLSNTTLTRYLSLLESAFLFRRIPAWSSNRARRLLKTPKVLIADTGLLGHLLGLTSAAIETDPVIAGPLLESFVGVEILKQLSFHGAPASLHHFRTHAGREVDWVLESRDGRVVGIEVKAAATVGTGDARGLETLRELAGPRFHRGVILYTGRATVPFGRDITVMPISALWEM